MAEAQFYSPSTDTSEIFNRSSSNMMNLMERAQRSRWEQQDRAQAQSDRDMMMPVVKAKAEADIITANATKENYIRSQELRKQFAVDSVNAAKEYQEAMKLASYAAQSEALASLQQKYAWFSMIPEGKGFADTLANSRLQANQYALLDVKLNKELELEQEKYKNETNLKTLEHNNRASEETIRQEGLTARSRLMADSMKDRTNYLRELSEEKNPVNRIKKAKDYSDEIRDSDPDLADMLLNYAHKLSDKQQTVKPKTNPFIKDIVGPGGFGGTPTPSVNSGNPKTPVPDIPVTGQTVSGKEVVEGVKF